MSERALRSDSSARSPESGFRMLFTPLSVGGLKLKNRIIMPPMIDRLAEDGTVSERVKDFYAARARGGVALIVLTPGIVDESMASPIQLGIYEDRFIPRLKELTDLVHSCGCLMGIQLMHLGRQGEGIKGYQPVAPSPIPLSSVDEVPKELTTGEVERLVEQFADAARRAREAGFDLVELHACHGYLLSSFLSPHTNRRSDRYGGSIERRARMIIEVIGSIKKRAGADFPVSCRINGSDHIPDGVTPDMALRTAVLLEEAGANLIGISSGAYGSYPVIVPPYDQPRGCNVQLAGAVKEVVKVPVAVAGRLDDPFVADDVLVSGKADLVAVARGLLADPELPNKALGGELKDIRRCIACNVCIDGNPTEPITCTVNPEAGKEREMNITPASHRKRVAVVGGGLAGLETARVAALRGHDVHLYEEGQVLGGQWLLAGKPPHKQDHLLILDYLKCQIEKLGVKCCLGKAFTSESLAECRAGVLVVATGGVPLMPPIPGVDSHGVVTAWDVLRGQATGKRVLIIGGGMTGLETAEMLALQGKEVVLVEMLKRVGADMGATVRWHLMNRVKRLNLKIFTSTRIKEIRPGGAVVVSRDGVEGTWTDFDSIILSCGVMSREGTEALVAGGSMQSYVIGDAAKPRKGLDAIREGSETGRRI